MESRVLTIMFTDIKGFTESSGNRSRQAVLDLVHKHDELLRPVIDHFAGRIVKTIGDAFLVVFDSPTNGVLCGLLMQYRLQEYNQTVAEHERIEVRIALNSGEVQLTRDDVYGEPVNVAARINALTEPNEVYFTETVYLSMNRHEAPSCEVGERKLKGVTYPVTIYKVIQDPGSDQYRQVVAHFKGILTDKRHPPSATEEITKGRPALPLHRPWRLGVASMVLLAILALAVWQLLPLGPAWAGKARNFADQGAYDQAWELLDHRFGERPGDTRINAVADDILDQQLARLLEREGFEATLEHLQDHRQQRPYIRNLDLIITRTREQWAEELLASDSTQATRQALSLLDQVARAHPDEPGKLLNFALVYADWEQASLNRTAELFSQLLTTAPELATEPALKEAVLDFVRSHRLPPHRESARELHEHVAKHYLEAVRPWMRSRVTESGEYRQRRTAFAIFDAAGEIDARERFEYHRINLFEYDGSIHEEGLEEAVAYFQPWLEEPAEARAMADEPACEELTTLRYYGRRSVRQALPIFSTLFFEPCEPFLQNAVVHEDQAGLRYNAYEVLTQRDALTDEARHRYHLLSLAEHRGTGLAWRYPWIQQALSYLTETDINQPVRRREALTEVEALLTEIGRVRENRHIQQNPETLQWLEGELNKARARLQ